jgi:hypothetical protein
MKKNRHNFAHYYNNNLSFIDMLLNLTVGFVFLFLLSFMLIAVQDKNKPTPELKAEVIIMLSWADGSPDDIDLWCLTPDNQQIGYPHKDGKYIFLDHDDTGLTSNSIDVNGKSVLIPTRREVISIRLRKPGKYVVNSYFFKRHGFGKDQTGSVPIDVELDEINPAFNVKYKRHMVMDHEKQEMTAFSFDITDKGEIANISEAPYMFVQDVVNEQMGLNGEPEDRPPYNPAPLIPQLGGNQRWQSPTF